LVNGIILDNKKDACFHAFGDLLSPEC